MIKRILIVLLLVFTLNGKSIGATVSSLVWDNGSVTTGDVVFTGEVKPEGNTCADGEIIKKTSSNIWACAADAGGGAATSLALSSNPGNCSAGQAAGGIDTTGAAETCIDPIVATEIDSLSEFLAIVGLSSTGSGNFVLATSPTLVTPSLGTPSVIVLTNATGTPTAAIGLANATGLPVSTGISGLGTGVATALGLSVTGSGGPALSTSPVFTTDIRPSGNGATDIGTTTVRWGNVFLDTGKKLDFNNGNCTVTHSSGVLTLGGTCNLALGANSLTGTGSLGATGAGKLTKVWAVDVESTNVPTVGGTSLTSLAQTLTNKILDCDAGTGNDCTLSSKVWLAVANCQNTTPTIMWDLPTSSPAVAACITGTNTQKGVADFADSASLSIQQTVALPSDWSGAIDAKFKWLTTATSGSVVWQIATICVADAETDDPAFNTASTVTDAAKGTTNQTNDASITGVTATGCAAGELMHIKVLRDSAHASDSLAATARLIGVELTLRRTQ